MKKWISLFVVSLLFTAGLSGCGTISGTGGEMSADAQIASDVRERLANDPTTGRCNIGVSVSDGVVTLDGSVPDGNARLRAKDVARGTEGAKGVVDNLRSN